MTGFEHSTAALMLYSGMVDQGVESIGNIRSRYDGEKRNPWDEAECGHHYARAMASWTSVVALSGFHYDGPQASVVAVPRVPHKVFDCFWSTGTGWGTFSYRPTGTAGTQLTLRVVAGELTCVLRNFRNRNQDHGPTRRTRQLPHGEAERRTNEFSDGASPDSERGQRPRFGDSWMKD